MYYIIRNRGKYESLKIIVWHMDLLFLRLFCVTQRPMSLLGESELIMASALRISAVSISAVLGKQRQLLPKFQIEAEIKAL